MLINYTDTIPPLLRGVASLGTLDGNVHTDNQLSTSKTDQEAIQSDWNAVGKDIAGALNEYAEATK